MKRMLSIILLIFSLLMFFSCSDHNTALLYYLANVTKIIDNSLDNKSTISAMVHDTGGGAYYVSAGGSIWSRSEIAGTTLWESVTLPSGAAYCTAMTLFVFDGNLYASFLMSDDSYAFYSAAQSLTPGWSAVTDIDIDGKQILKLSDVNVNLFVSTKDGADYNLYYSGTGGDNSFSDTTLPTQTKPVLDVVHDGSNYFVITGAKLFSGANESSISTLEPTTSAPSEFGGLFYYFDVTHHYYLSSKEGIVYFTDDATADTWTASSIQTDTITGKVVPFTSFGKVGANVMVGTVGYGFYEMSDGTVTSLTRLQALTAVDLYNGWVTGFLLNSPRVFVFTAGSGLWSRSYSGGAWDGENWTHE